MAEKRGTEEVFEDHLRLRLDGRLEDDLRHNYSEDVVLLTSNSNRRGHDALRISAKRLSEQLPGADYEFIAKQVNGPYALLVWSAKSDGCTVRVGADSFVIEGGKIVMQTIHYGLLPPANWD